MADTKKAPQSAKDPSEYFSEAEMHFRSLLKHLATRDQYQLSDSQKKTIDDIVNAVKSKRAKLLKEETF